MVNHVLVNYSPQRGTTELCRAICTNEQIYYHVNAICFSCFCYSQSLVAFKLVSCVLARSHALLVHISEIVKKQKDGMSLNRNCTRLPVFSHVSHFSCLGAVFPIYADKLYSAFSQGSSRYNGVLRYQHEDTSSQLMISRLNHIDI